MKIGSIICLFIFVGSVYSIEAGQQNDTKEMLLKQEKKFSQYVLKVLEHYKQKDPVGIPGAPIPDPMDIPPLQHSFSIGKMDFRDVKLYGLKKFRIDHIKANISKMEVEAALTIDKLDVFGNYTLRTWLSKAQGPFTVKLTKVYVMAIATLKVEREGQLEAQEMDMDITFKDITMDFKGLGFFASMFQGVMNSVGGFVFDSIKPFILKEVNTNLRKDVNEQVRKFPQKFPNSVSPFDQLINELRKKTRNAGYDPYKVNDYNNSAGVFDIQMSHTWVYGLSSFHRTKDIIFEIRENTVKILLEVGTQKLLGTSHWQISLVTGLLAKAGTVSFSIDYLQVEVAVNQTMDTRNKPQLEDIQLELGNMQVRFDGLGTVDYLIEFGVNVIPNLLRYQIMDAIEGPIKIRIQDALNQVNVEEFIKENVEKLDDPKQLSFLNM